MIPVGAAAISVEPFVTPVETGMIPFKSRAIMIVVEVVTIVSVPCRVGVECCVRIIRVVHQDWSRNTEIDVSADINLGITGGSYQASGYDHGGN